MNYKCEPQWPREMPSRMDKGGSKLKKLLFGAILLTLVSVFPTMTMAAVNVSIGSSLPPPIVFAAPPALIVIPETYVYVVPDIDVDLFFWNGWWWRLWEGRWYRSRYYNRGWAYYQRVPSFYFDVDPGWRGYYRGHEWHGHRWNYKPIPYRQVQQNWKGWRDNRHWERRGTWGVQGYQSRPQPERQELRHQREVQYQQRPEVQRHMQERQEQQRKQPQVRKPQGPQREPQVRQPQHQQHPPEVQKSRGPEQPQQQHSQPQGRPHEKESPHQQGKPEGRDAEHRK